MEYGKSRGACHSFLYPIYYASFLFLPPLACCECVVYPIAWASAFGKFYLAHMHRFPTHRTSEFLFKLLSQLADNKTLSTEPSLCGKRNGMKGRKICLFTLTMDSSVAQKASFPLTSDSRIFHLHYSNFYDPYQREKRFTAKVGGIQKKEKFEVFFKKNARFFSEVGGKLVVGGVGRIQVSNNAFLFREVGLGNRAPVDPDLNL